MNENIDLALGGESARGLAQLKEPEAPIYHCFHGPQPRCDTSQIHQTGRSYHSSWR